MILPEEGVPGIARDNDPNYMRRLSEHKLALNGNQRNPKTSRRPEF